MKKLIDAFRTKLCQKTDIPSTAINMYLLTTNTTIVTTIDLERLDLTESK